MGKLFENKTRLLFCIIVLTLVNPFYGASKKKKKTANEPEQTPVIAAENTVPEVVESVVEIDTDIDQRP